LDKNCLEGEFPGEFFTLKEIEVRGKKRGTGLAAWGDT
jgi:hypothetical protein